MKPPIGKHGYSKRVRRKSRLIAAWQIVLENGLKSKSRETTKAVNAFRTSAESQINKIQKKLQNGTWKFDPSDGILAKRKGKSPRPIVVASVPNRIVQRSILDVLQDDSSIKKYIHTPSSFGGVKSKKVRDAIECAYRTIDAGMKFYIRSDIKGFFTKIPRNAVIDIIAGTIPDESFIQLLTEATDVELRNLEQLKNFGNLFPLRDVGVAQGCCLSPLMGNIILYNFDKMMNEGGVTTLRYIDDFLILAPDQKTATKAFQQAKEHLKTYSMSVYDPSTDRQKAEHGSVSTGFTFLGCKIVKGLITPTRKSQDQLIKKVNEIFDESISHMTNPDEMKKKKVSLIETLSLVDRTVSGWGNQYAFCNDRQQFVHVDAKINEAIKRYLSFYHRHKTRLSEIKDDDSMRQLLGIQPLNRCKKDFILPLKPATI